MMKNNVVQNFDIFVAFLKSKGVYNLYRHYLITTSCRTTRTEELIKFIRRKPIEKKLTEVTFLSYAFIWSKTKQGDEFWRTLHTEWSRSFCGNKNDSWTLDELKYPIRNVFKYEKGDN